MIKEISKEYCESKAFDYKPHFLTLIAMVLYTGCRGNEMYDSLERAKI